MFNTARLAEWWRDANGDPVRMAAALGEELSRDYNQLVTKAISVPLWPNSEPS